MRILIVNTDHPGFLDALYARHPGLRERPYREQMRVRMESLFGVADYYSRNLVRLGHQAWDVHANNPWMQAAWAREQGLDPGPLQEGRWRLRRGLLPWFSRALRRDRLQAVLSAQIAHLRPDVILNQDMAAIPPSALRRDRGDCLLVGQHPCLATLPPPDRLREYDLLVSSMPSAVERFRSLGIPARLSRLGFEPGVLDGLEKDAGEHPVTFVGGLSALHRGRIAFLEALSRLVPDLRIWAPDLRALRRDSPLRRCYRGPAWGREALRILRASRITLNRHEDAAAHANNLRLYEATGAGALLLTDWTPDLHALFEPGREVAAYRNVEEAARLIRHYLDREDRRAAVARAGQERTLREHTYLDRMRELARHLEGARA